MSTLLVCAADRGLMGVPSWELPCVPRGVRIGGGGGGPWRNVRPVHGRGHLDQTGTSFTCAVASFTASSSPLFWGEGLSLEGLRQFGDNVKHRIRMLSTSKARTP